MSEPRIYKTSPALLVIIAVMFIFFLGVLFIAFGPGSPAFVIPLALLSLFLFGAAFVALASKTMVSDDGVTIQGFFGAKNLKWTEVGRVGGWGYSMKLHSRDEDMTIAVSPRLPGYQEVIEFVGSKRPDLFSPREYGEIKRGLTPFIGMFIVALLVIGVSIGLILTSLDSADTSFAVLVPLLVFVTIVIFFAATTFSIPRSLTLEGNTMTLKYLFSEKSVRADEVSSIQYSYTQSQNGRHYFIALYFSSRRAIHLRGLGISLPVAYLVLKNWHRAGSGSTPQSHNAIAPNWSDNTWR